MNKRLVGIILGAFVLGLILFFIISMLREGTTDLSPVPEGGVKVIQLTPSDK